MAQAATPLVPYVTRFAAPPALWLLHLLVVYAATALVCARDAADRSVLSIAIVPFSVLVASVAAVAAIALPLAHAWRAETAASAPERSDTQRFADRLAIGLAVVSLVGVAWTASAVFFVPPCGGPGAEATDAQGAAAGAWLGAVLGTRAGRARYGDARRGGLRGRGRRGVRGSGGRAARRGSALALGALALLGCRAGDAPVRVVGGNAERGRALVAAYQCGVCHAIPGMRPRGVVGPPLEGFARRAFIGGRLPNTPANLVRWVRDPPAVDSRTAMPAVGLDEQEARDVAAYLYQLR